MTNLVDRLRQTALAVAAYRARPIGAVVTTPPEILNEAAEEIERLRKLLDGRTFVTGDHEPLAPQVSRPAAAALATESTEQAAPAGIVYRKWPGEPPHCMSCDCGMTEEQKKTVPLDDYLRVHRELIDLKYQGTAWDPNRCIICGGNHSNLPCPQTIVTC